MFQGNSDFIKTTVVCPAYINTGMFDGVQVRILKIPLLPLLILLFSEQDHPDPGPPVCGRPGGGRHLVQQGHHHAPLVDLLPHHAQGSIFVCSKFTVSDLN